jgi:hypothetical protein
MHHLPTELGVYGGMVLTLIAAALGVITGVRTVIQHGSLSLMVWSVGAILPAVLLFFVFRPMIK